MNDNLTSLQYIVGICSLMLHYAFFIFPFHFIMKLTVCQILFAICVVKYGAGQEHLKQNATLAELDEKYSKCQGIDIREITIAQIQHHFAAGTLTSVQLTECYLQRIAHMDPVLKSVIEVNPDAMDMAKKADNEREHLFEKGLLHGIPVLLKDNLCTEDRMKTTAGSLALVNLRCRRDASVVVELRKAGAVILGKTNLSEFAGFRGTNLADTPGWSSRGGQTKNPYNLQVTPSGSSTGSAVAVAANLAVVSVGTETDGSLIGPAGVNGLWTLKPTRGIPSTMGIIPLSSTQDTVGPMARTVSDLAILYDGMIRKTKHRHRRHPRSYLESITQTTISKPFRIGIMRHPYFNLTLISSEALEHQIPQMDVVFSALEKSSKFELVNTTVPYLYLRRISVMNEWEMVFSVDFKHGITNFLENEFYHESDNNANPEADNATQIRTLSDIVKFCKEHPFPQGYNCRWLEKAENSPGRDDESYKYIRKMNKESARAVLKAALWPRSEDRPLDAVVAPTDYNGIIHSPYYWDVPWAGFQIAAISGCPSINIPIGVGLDGVPYGITVMGAPYSEAKLLQIAYTFEQIIHTRARPKFLFES